MPNGLPNRYLLIFSTILTLTICTGLLAQAGTTCTESLGKVELEGGTEYFVVAHNHKNNGSYFSEIWLQERRWASSLGDKKVLKINGRLGPKEKEKVFANVTRKVKNKEKTKFELNTGEIMEMVIEGVEYAVHIGSAVAEVAVLGMTSCIIIDFGQFDYIRGYKGKHTDEYI